MHSHRPHRLTWSALLDSSADRYDGTTIAITGWPVTASEAVEARYTLLAPEPACCRGCLPTDPAACVEVFAAAPVPCDGRAMTLRGVFRRLHDDPCGWRYRLDGAVVVPEPACAPRLLSRRGAVAAAPLLCLPTGLAAQEQPPDTVGEAQRAQALAFLAARPTVDCHSHAGRILRLRQDDAPFSPLAAPMRAGGLAVTCLAIVSGAPTHRVTPEGRIRAFREPEAGELATYAERGFARLHALARAQGLPIVRTAADLAAARAAAPSILVAAEGADFLEGDLGRLRRPTAASPCATSS